MSTTNTNRALKAWDIFAEAAGMTTEAFKRQLKSRKRMFFEVSGDRLLIQDTNGKQLNWLETETAPRIGERRRARNNNNSQKRNKQR